MKRVGMWILLGVSILGNIILATFVLHRPGEPTQFSERYPYLSLRISLENQNDIVVNVTKLRGQLQQYVAGVKDPIGLYFEYLPSGASVGINEKDTFLLASLLKVPLVMAVYKQINDKAFTMDTILKVQKKNIDPYFGDLWKKGEGAEVTVREAIRLTLVNSDNTAKSLLFSTLPTGSLEEMFDTLDIPKEFGEQPVVSPKNYSSILRSLYLSSYLPEEESNEILELLTQSPFNDQIAAGVPSYIKVAHKIGVTYSTDDPNHSILTDCGILYVPKRPYILCMMMKTTKEESNRVMAEISKIVYDFIASIP